MKNILNFFLIEHPTLFFILWCFVGTVFFWISVLITQIFYWKKKGKVAIMFSAVRDMKDLVYTIILSILCSILGILGLGFIFSAIKEVLNESQRLKLITKL